MVLNLKNFFFRFSPLVLSLTGLTSPRLEQDSYLILDPLVVPPMT